MGTFKRGGVYAYDFTRQGIRYTRSGFGSRRVAAQAEAVHKAHLLDTRLQREYGLRPTRALVPTVRHFIETEWLPSQKQILAASTYRIAGSHSKKLLAHFGPIRVSDLSTKDVETYRDTRLAVVSPNQVREDIRWLRRMIRTAIQRGYLEGDPSHGVRLPRATRTPDRILTTEEEVRLLSAIWLPNIKALVRFALLTGLRLQELCGLMWRQVSLDSRKVSIHQPKTNVLKVLPLVEDAVAVLRSVGPRDPDTPVFRGRNGPCTCNGITRYFVRARRRATIQELRFQDLRHTVAVRLLERGVDIPTVGMILGHKPPYTTTLRYVAHTSQARARMALEALPNSQQAHGKNVS